METNEIKIAGNSLPEQALAMIASEASQGYADPGTLDFFGEPITEEHNDSSRRAKLRAIIAIAQQGLATA